MILDECFFSKFTSKLTINQLTHFIHFSKSLLKPNHTFSFNKSQTKPMLRGDTDFKSYNLIITSYLLYIYETQYISAVVSKNHVFFSMI